MGTLEESGALSIFVISAMLICVGLFLKGKITRIQCIVLGLVLLVPTMINETKISFLFVPLGLLTAVLIGTPRGRRLSIVGWTAGCLIGAGAIAIPVYDYTQQNNPYPQKISLDLFTDTKKNYSELDGAGVGAPSYVGRKDALTIPIEYLSRDPVWLAFGLGIGNASESSIGNGFTGEYGHLFKMVAISDTSQFLLERGFFGVALYFLIYYMIFRDAVVVAHRDTGILGAVATGWAGIVVILALATFYKTTQAWSSAAFLFWYFSGVIAARRMQLVVREGSLEFSGAPRNLVTPIR